MKGVTVQLIAKTQTSTDPFGRPIVTEQPIDVQDVLVGEPSTDEINNTFTMYGKRIAYTLAIPKGDTHTWADTEVILPEPFGGRYKTIGYPIAGIEENIPLRWNKKVHLERYEG